MRVEVTMKQPQLSSLALLVALVVGAQQAQAQYLLNENFDDPSLPGWTWGGETSAGMEWNVSGGTLNFTGFTGGAFNRTLQMIADLDLQGPTGPTTWMLETRFWLPSSQGRNVVNFTHIQNTPSEGTFAQFSANNSNTTGQAVLVGTQSGARVDAPFDSWHVLQVEVTPTLLRGVLDGVEFGIVSHSRQTEIVKLGVDITIRDSDMSGNTLKIDYVKVVPEPLSGVACLVLFVTFKLVRKPK